MNRPELHLLIVRITVTQCGTRENLSSRRVHVGRLFAFLHNWAIIRANRARAKGAFMWLGFGAISAFGRDGEEIWERMKFMNIVVAKGWREGNDPAGISIRNEIAWSAELDLTKFGDVKKTKQWRECGVINNDANKWNISFQNRLINVEVISFQ